MTQIDIAICVDRSASMSSPYAAPPIDVAKADVNFFVAIMAADNKAGMTEFATSASTGYALNTMSASNKTNLINAVGALNADGWSTNIQAGVNQSNGLLTDSSASNSIVLLTDGRANAGTRPPVAPAGSATIYPIGLGPYVSKSNLTGLAKKTSGTYYGSPTTADLMKIYLEITAAAGVGAVLTNTKGTAGPSSVTGTTVVSEGTPSVRIGTSWVDVRLTYTTSVPQPGEITLLITCPNGTTQPANPDRVGSGYVEYLIDNPTPGTYTSSVVVGAGHVSSTTIGGVDHSQQASLTYTDPGDVRVGGTVTVPCRVLDADGSPVERWSLSGHVESPLIDPDTALAQNRAELDALDLKPEEEDGEISDNQRMLTLDQIRGPNNPVIPRAQLPLSISHGEGENRFSFTPQTKGTHIAQFMATGHAPKAGRDFSLVRVATIAAD